MVARTLTAEALARHRVFSAETMAAVSAEVPGAPVPIRGGRAVHDTAPAVFAVFGPHYIGKQCTRAHLADQAVDRRVGEGGAFRRRVRRYDPDGTVRYVSVDATRDRIRDGADEWVERDDSNGAPIWVHDSPYKVLDAGAGTRGARDRDIAASAVVEQSLLTFRAEADEVVHNEAMALVDPWQLDVVNAPLPSGKKLSQRMVTRWSPASRNRMSNVYSRIDWTPLFESGRTPVEITLTLPDHWEVVAPTPEAFRRKLETWRVYYQRAWGAKIQGAWKIEFQRPRKDHPDSGGAPHVHAVLTPPEGLAAGRLVALRGREFREWLSASWAHVVAHPDPLERAKHLRAGTNVKVLALEVQGPESMADYFAKHGRYSEKEYQNQMPQLWRDAIANGESAGFHFWGKWGLVDAARAVQLTTVDAGSATVETVLDPLGLLRLARKIFHYVSSDVRRPHPVLASLPCPRVPPHMLSSRLSRPRRQSRHPQDSVRCGRVSPMAVAVPTIASEGSASA